MLEKTNLRLEIQSQIQLLDEACLKQGDRGILENLLALPEFINAPRIFTYCSVDREADTREIIRRCRDLDKTVALPRTISGGRLDFAVLDRPLSQLPRGCFGIPQPPEDAPSVSPQPRDLILVPALCFDLNGYRLGHGGGFYDRFLADCQGISVGLCREALLQPDLPREPHDRPVSLLITDKRIARPEGPAI